MYTRINPEILQEISSMNDGRTPRGVYKAMVLDDSINYPRDFKQVRNVKYQKEKKENDGGEINNLADEVRFVQHCSKAKGRMPNFICYTQGFNILSFTEK